MYRLNSKIHDLQANVCIWFVLNNLSKMIVFLWRYELEREIKTKAIAT